MFDIFTSTVYLHEGPCIATWLNDNQVCNRFDRGVTGFFKRVKVWHGIALYSYGPEFHGIIKDGKTVESTYGIYSSL